MDSQTLMADAEKRAADYFARLPDDMTVRRAMALGFSGERNLAMRKALGIKFPGKTVVQVGQQDWIQVVTRTRAKAEWHAQQLREALPEFTVTVNDRGSEWLVAGYPSSLVT